MTIGSGGLGNGGLTRVGSTVGVDADTTSNVASDAPTVGPATPE